MRVIILPSRLHTFRVYSWRAHSILGNNVKIQPKENELDVVDYSGPAEGAALKIQGYS